MSEYILILNIFDGDRNVSLCYFQPKCENIRKNEPISIYGQDRDGNYRMDIYHSLPKNIA